MITVRVALSLMTVFCYIKLAFYYLEVEVKVPLFWAELTFRFLREILYTYLLAFVFICCLLKKMWYLKSTPSPPTPPNPVSPPSERISMRQSKVDSCMQASRTWRRGGASWMRDTGRSSSTARWMTWSSGSLRGEVVAGSHELGQDYGMPRQVNSKQNSVGVQHRVGCGRPCILSVEQRKQPRLSHRGHGFHFC